MELNLTLNEYQMKAAETANYHEDGDTQWDDVNYCVGGLCGESGEVANKFKKVKRDDHKVITEKRRMDLAHELGDVLWYVAMCAKELGFALDEIAQMNYEKLRSRQERGKISGEGDDR